MRIMDYYRLNQIAMAVLGALLLFFGTRTIVNIAFQEHKPEVAEQKAEEKKPAEGGANLATLLASANPAHGADVAKKCSICHNFDKGGPNMIGPDLYGVLGRKVASHEGYEYSEALKAKAAELGNWDYEKIDHMINNPGAFVPGTKMALFPGLPDPKERADVLVFLRTKNDNPPPLPMAPAGGAPTAEQKPAEGEKPAAAAGGAEIDKLLASADPKQGEADAALCKVCHTFDKGGAAVVGPNVYGVIGRKIASVEGFNYTDALKAHQKDGVWTYELLDPWLTNPQAFAPGTAMAFPGIPDAKKRANVIAFLRSKSDTPPPLPSAGGAAPEKKPEGTPATAPAPSAATPPPAAPAPAPSAETPPPAAPAPAPSAETPPPAAPAPAPSAETPPPAAPAPAPSAETPPALAVPPAAETPAPAPSPSGETPAPPPAPSPQTPETTAPAPSAETPPTAAPAPSAETPQQPAETPPPSAKTPPPSAETPPPQVETPAPSAETPAPSAGTPAPSAETPSAESPGASAETPPGTETPSEGEGPFPSQPQPVYPEGPPPGQ
jgi:cytochrome c